MRLLHSSGTQVLEDHLRKALLRRIVGVRLRGVVNEFVILVNAEFAMWREALDGEWPGDSDLAVVLVGTVVVSQVTGTGEADLK